ncbi:hypothetical protein QJS04_geneDACA003159 [Acorus gramineus]|uniref:VQ domain-containing protein n=1 Tax=Acorus gramineus TaxID=55184 RepID=A0AAV9BXM9_ACOGR|nr:hypothetical protein QJS04_geneDACA003159 [Acorus gramineus]
MEKKAFRRSQKSVKICKSDQRKQESLLCKVLPPKVYITDSSCFRSLVQELTGNGASSPQLQPVKEQIPVIAIEDLEEEPEEFSVGECSIDSEEANFDSLENLTEFQLREVELATPSVFDIEEFLSMEDFAFPFEEEVWSLPWDVLNYMASFDVL